MLKAAVPRPTATRKRSARPCAREARARSRRTTAAARSARLRRGVRASCFHSAMMFSTMVTTAAPCTTWISRSWREVGEQHAEQPGR